ncbi:hypothetical protein HDV01_005109 [Terramyces sp. JEL0728]|nr:hypothetical protein HDV01_005109 [Terramyces sp. JEL0728]
MLGKELKIMLEVDDQIDDQLDSTQSKASSTQKKKKALQASGMEKIIALADKVFNPYGTMQAHQLWKPTNGDISKITQFSKSLKCSGIRGLRNMGSTCFMNTILQTFLHNPFLKAHFLSDKHSSAVCQKEASTCMTCQLDKLFSQFYASDTTPFTPHAFLYAMWMSQKHLAGYSQQDAHEFFISVLDEIHNNCSDVTCLQCNNVTFSYDPILDLSLEIKTSAKQTKKKKVESEEDMEYTLSECLDDDGVPSYQYNLFAVVCHEGKLDTGHYKAFCKINDVWFEFDDHNVSIVEYAQVMKCNVYMCFYVKQFSSYVPNEFGDQIPIEVKTEDVVMDV